MARIRSIKPEFFADELLGTLPRDLRLLYVGLWTLADDDGRFRANPALIRSALFPYDEDLTQHQVSDWLGTLAGHDRVLLYEHGGQQYGVIRRWSQHQKIAHPSLSKLPAPPKLSQKAHKIPRATDSASTSVEKAEARNLASDAGNSSRGSHETLANPPETLMTDHEGKGREGIGREGSDLAKGPQETRSGIGLVCDAFESHFGKPFLGEPLAYATTAIDDGQPPAHVAAALIAADWFVENGAKYGLVFVWRKLVEQTKLGGVFRWDGVEYEPELDGDTTPPSSGSRSVEDALADTPYTLYKPKAQRRAGRSS